jgi:hypothetical protein
MKKLTTFSKSIQLISWKNCLGVIIFVVGLFTISPNPTLAVEQDFMLNKINHYGSKEHEDLDDLLRASDGNYIAIGNEGFETDSCYIAKLNPSNLEVIEEKLFGIDSNHRVCNFSAVIETDNAYIGVGYVENINYDYGADGFIVKFNNKDFNDRSVQLIEGNSYDWFHSVVEGENNFIVVGASQSDLSSYGGSAGDGSFKFLISEFNKDNLALNNLYNYTGSESSGLNDIIRYDSSNFVAVGYEDKNRISGDDFLIVKFTESNLASFNKYSYQADGHDVFNSVIKGDNNNLIAAGLTNSDFTALEGSANSGGLDFLIAEFNSDLKLNQINNFGGSASDALISIVETDNNYIVSGDSASDLSAYGGNPVYGGKDFVIGKINKSDLSAATLYNFGGSEIEWIKSLYKVNNYKFIGVGYNESDLTHLGGIENQGVSDFVAMEFQLENPVDGLYTIFRFWSDQNQSHFYTIDTAERDNISLTWPEIWTYEAPVFKAYKSDSIEGLSPVYRFWSDQNQKHFYTISEEEKDNVIAKWPDIWTYEGIAYYAYAGEETGTKPLYRFWSDQKQGHFYTASTEEKDNVIATWPDIWTYEGVAYYVK